MTSSDFQVEIRREFPTPREVVFRVLSEPEFVQRWFFPRKDVVLTIEQFDFVPNGRYRFLYALPDGTLSKVHGRFTSIRRPELVEFTWTWEPPDPHADEETLVTWRLEEIDGGTRLVVTHERIPDDYLPMFRPGWAQTIQHLAEVLESILHERN